jgi:putative ABC transport system permease protein
MVCAVHNESMPTWLQDLRFAFRQLRKTPGVAVLAAFTLALGVGGNAAIFTVIESVVIRPLPYAHAGRLVAIGSAADKNGIGATSWLNYRDVRDQTREFRDVAAYSQDVSVVQTEDESESVVAPRVTPNLFSILGARPLLGRTFTNAEGQPGGAQSAILSAGLWRTVFHSDPHILGRVVKIGGIARTVVGVMPDAFRFPESVGTEIRKGLWLPLQPTAEMLKGRGYVFLNALGELRSGASVAQAQQELNAIAARIPRDPGDDPIALRGVPYLDAIIGPVRPVLYSLFTALALVLLIACTNVSNLLIARCLARQHEFAVRASLGAGRWRLIRQLLAEGMVLSVLGCLAGVLLAEWAMFAVKKLPEGTIPRGDSIAIHWTIVLVLAAIAVVTTVLSSLMPALLVARSNPQAALQAGSRGMVSRSMSGRLSACLVAGEVALSTLLLVGTGLLFHTLWNLERARLGFVATRVTTFTAMPADSAGFSAMAVSEDTSHAPTSVATLMYGPVLDRIRQLPDVQSAALATARPLSGMDVSSSFEIAGQPKNPASNRQAQVSAVSGDYARTMGTALLRGRMLSDADIATAPFVAVVNETFAKKYFGGQEPLGKRIELGGKDTGMIQPYAIVGILADQVQGKIGGEVQPLILLSEQQIPTTSLFYQALLKTMVSFVVKTRGDTPVAAEMRALFHQAAPGFALDDFQTMQQVIEKSTFSQRLGLYLVGLFAGLAAAMVFAGLYGVLSQVVSYRRREFGLRMALGATQQSIARLMLRQGSSVIGWGLVIGLALAFAMGRFVESYLYEVRPLDAFTYVAVAVVLSAIGLAALLIPARRAVAIDPMQALRED